MKVRLWVCCLLVTALFAAPESLPAQNVKSKKKADTGAATVVKPTVKAEPASTEASSAAGKVEAKNGSDASKDNSGAMGGGALEDLGLKEMHARKIRFDEASGGMSMSDDVLFETDQFKLICDQLDLDPKTKVLTALGKRVKFDQAGVKAECGRLLYDTQKKSSRLEGDPIVLQQGKGKVTKMVADIFTIVENEKGQRAVNMEMLPNSNRMPTVTTIKQEAAPGGEKQPVAPKKVNNENMDLIRMPELGNQ